MSLADDESNESQVDPDIKLRDASEIPAPEANDIPSVREAAVSASLYDIIPTVYDFIVNLEESH